MLVSLIIIASLTIPVNTVDAKQSILEPLLANKLTKKSFPKTILGRWSLTNAARVRFLAGDLIPAP